MVAPVIRHDLFITVIFLVLLLFSDWRVTSSFSQPAVLGGQAATVGRAPPSPLVSILVNLGEGSVHILEFSNGQNAADVANAFGIKHRLSSESVRLLREEIELRVLLAQSESTTPSSSVTPSAEEEVLPATKQHRQEVRDGDGVVAALTAALKKRDEEAAAAAAAQAKKEKNPIIGPTTSNTFSRDQLPRTGITVVDTREDKDSRLYLRKDGSGGGGGGASRPTLTQPPIRADDDVNKGTHPTFITTMSASNDVSDVSADGSKDQYDSLTSGHTTNDVSNIDAIKAHSIALQAEAEARYNPADPDLFYVDLELNGAPAPLVFRRSNTKVIEEEVEEAAETYLAPLNLAKGKDESKAFVVKKILLAIKDQDFPPIKPQQQGQQARNVQEIAAEFESRALKDLATHDSSAYFVDLRINDLAAPLVYRLSDGDIDQVAREYCLAFGSEDMHHHAFVSGEIRKAVTDRDKADLVGEEARRAHKSGKMRKDKKTPAATAKSGANKVAASTSAADDVVDDDQEGAEEGGWSWLKLKLKLRWLVPSAWAAVVRGFMAVKQAAYLSGLLQWEMYVVGVVVVLVVLGCRCVREEERKIFKRKCLHLPAGVARPLSLSRRWRTTVTSYWLSTSTATSTAISAFTWWCRGGRKEQQHAADTAVEGASAAGDRNGGKDTAGSIKKGKVQAGKGKKRLPDCKSSDARTGQPSQERKRELTAGGRQQGEGEREEQGGEKRVRFEIAHHEESTSPTASATAAKAVTKENEKDKEEFSWDAFLSKHCESGGGGGGGGALFFALGMLSTAGAMLGKTAGFNMETHEACDWTRLVKNKRGEMVIGGQKYVVLMRVEGTLFVSCKDTGVKMMSCKTKTGFIVGMFREASKGEAKDALSLMVDELAKLKR